MNPSRGTRKRLVPTRKPQPMPPSVRAGRPADEPRHGGIEQIYLTGKSTRDRPSQRSARRSPYRRGCRLWWRSRSTSYPGRGNHRAATPRTTSFPQGRKQRLHSRFRRRRLSLPDEATPHGAGHTFERWVVARSKPPGTERRCPSVGCTRTSANRLRPGGSHPRGVDMSASINGSRTDPPGCFENRPALTGPGSRPARFGGTRTSRAAPSHRRHRTHLIVLC
jgi:hypothetical protein